LPDDTVADQRRPRTGFPLLHFEGNAPIRTDLIVKSIAAWRPLQYPPLDRLRQISDEPAQIYPSSCYKRSSCNGLQKRLDPDAQG